MTTADGGNGRVEYGRFQQTVEDLRELHGPDGACGRRWSDMETRMRKVEGFRWQIIGVLGAINAVGVVTILLALRAWMTP